MSSANHTPLPRPIPQFFNEYNHLATKKERYSFTPKPQLPPRPPSKSITQYSRLSFSLNSSQFDQKAQIISFSDHPPKLSPLYNHNSRESYLKQCFHIEEKIGSGSFGDVFRVRSRLDNKYYAVKVSREKFKGKIDREEKLNEVCKHEQLPQHDHLIKLHCAWEERQRLYIETELCAGTLSSLAENNHDIQEEVVWAYLVDLLKAIHHLHSNNLIHLDIKPENIFISRDGICKLGDFGLIYDMTNRHSKGPATEGDPKYLAGEIMQGIFTKSADIFSLGMTILEIASDLDLPSRGQAWHMLRDGKIPEHLLQNRSDDLKTIIAMMLSPDYRKRPTAAELLSHRIVKKYEWKRRYELNYKKLMALFRDKIRFIDNLFVDPNETNSISHYVWSSVIVLMQMLIMPLQFLWTHLFLPYQTELPQMNCNMKNDDQRKKSSPNNNYNNYNRTYVSNYLDHYSDDDLIQEGTKHFSNFSFDMSYSSDEEMFSDNLSSRNLCSTVNRNAQKIPMFPAPILSPLVSSNHKNYNGDDVHLSPNSNYHSIRSVIQKLTFDDYSSDEMAMSEMEDNDDNNCSMDKSQHTLNSSSLSSLKSETSSLRCSGSELSAKNVSNIGLLRKNVSRKNLMKTFDEIEELKT